MERVLSEGVFRGRLSGVDAEERLDPRLINDLTGSAVESPGLGSDEVAGKEDDAGIGGGAETNTFGRQEQPSTIPKSSPAPIRKFEDQLVEFQLRQLGD